MLLNICSSAPILNADECENTTDEYPKRTCIQTLPLAHMHLHAPLVQ